MIRSRRAKWTASEIETAVAALKKIAHTQEKGEWIPPPFFEAHVLSKKNMSTVVVPLNAKGEVYLVRRPTREENPSEPYPDMYHIPGVTHLKDELLSETIARLQESEGMKFSSLKDIGALEGVYKKRGTYLVRVFVGKLKEMPTNPEGKFFSMRKIPWKKIIDAERKYILSLALRKIGNLPRHAP